MAKQVFIIDGDHRYRNMFLQYGWKIAFSIDEADLVQFTGGADVSPSLYGEVCHPRTSCSVYRDDHEEQVYKDTLKRGVPMAGICRGGQFLNVMNGGKMYQDVNKHAIQGTHEAIDVITGGTIGVSSTHHQMMRPATSGEVLAIANLATYKEYMNESHERGRRRGNLEDDVEVVLYGDTKSLCFQPHPEFVVESDEYRECADYYFDCLERVV